MEQVAEVQEIQRVETSRLGVWAFLFWEILLFGSLFATYAVFRGLLFQDFHRGRQELDVTLGAMNTVILLLSSLTVVLAVAFIQGGRPAP